MFSSWVYLMNCKLYHSRINKVAHILQGTNVGDVELLLQLIARDAATKRTLILNKIQHLTILIKLIRSVIELVIQ